MSNKSLISRCYDALCVAQAGRVTFSNLLNMWLFGAYAYAGREVIRLNLCQRGHDLLAGLNRKGATCVKATTLRRINWRWHVAFQNYALSSRLYLRVWNGHG